MINSISAVLPKRLQALNPQITDAQLAPAVTNVESPGKIPGVFNVNPQAAEESFGDVLSQAVTSINTKMQQAEVEKARVMSGDSNNLHQAVLSMQEAGVAFSLMTEVRNKLVESYQEIMRMQV